MTLRVLHAPLHAPSAQEHPAAVVARIKSLNATTIGMTEAYNIVDQLGHVDSYRLVLEAGGKDKNRGQKDNPILVKAALRSKGSGQIFGCDASKPLRIAPERWITWSVVTVPGEGDVCHVALHPHAGVQGNRGRITAGSDRGAEYVKQMQALNRFLDFAVAMGWKIVVSGDMNFRDVGDSKLSPYVIMRAHGMDVFSKGLDAIGWTKALKLTVDEVTASDEFTDHSWLLGKTS